MNSTICNKVFEKSIQDYHIYDDVNQPMQNSFEEHESGYLLYHKNWVDTVQWHLEDIIRDPKINPEEALTLKRRIDASNQLRTDLVEQMDDFFMQQFKEVKPLPNASINTESPAWAIDRLSILHLKIYHMQIEANRQDATEEHIANCKSKLAVLEEQKTDLSMAIDSLLEDIAAGRKYMKQYKQMKMYNDEKLNPILYKQQK